MNPEDYVHATVATVVEHDGRFLLVEERASEGLVINQPAGHVEPGESLIEAARRETFEETGCDVNIEAMLGVARYSSPANGVSYLRISFIGRLLAEHENAVLDRGILRRLWLTAAELRAESARMRSPLVLASVEEYLAGTRWPLDLIYYNQ